MARQRRSSRPLSEAAACGELLAAIADRSPGRPARRARGGTVPARPRRARAARRSASFDNPVYVDPGARQPTTRVRRRAGRRVIAVSQGGRKLDEPFLDIRDQVASAQGGEEGLLSVAFDPDYARNGRFYVYYTTNGGDNSIDQYRALGRNDPRRDPRLPAQGDEDPPPLGRHHNGGQLQFGPDGYLYIGTGDGGCCERPARPARSLGQPARQAPADRPARRRGRGLPDPGRQPLRRPPGRGRDLRAGAAQPLALLLRPPDRHPGDRRRRRQPAGSRRSTTWRRRRPRAPTSAGPTTRASPATAFGRRRARSRR